MKTLQMRFDRYRYGIHKYITEKKAEVSMRKALDENGRSWKYVNSETLDLEEYVKWLELEVDKINWVEVEQ